MEKCTSCNLITKLLYRSSCSQVFLKIGVLTNFVIFTGKNLYWSLFLIKLHTWPTENLLKRDSNTGVFLWILRNFLEQPFLQNTSGGCFCTLGTTVPENIVRRNGKKYSHNKFSYNFKGSPTQAKHNSWMQRDSNPQPLSSSTNTLFLGRFWVTVLSCTCEWQVPKWLHSKASPLKTREISKGQEEILGFALQNGCSIIGKILGKSLCRSPVLQTLSCNFVKKGFNVDIFLINFRLF